MDWISNFKCRCSAIVKALADSRSNPQLTPNQAGLIIEYESRTKPPTENQKKEYARLLVLRENSSKVVLSDGYIDYLMEVYSWETEGMIPIGKESMDLMQMRKGKECETEGRMLLSAVDGEVYKVHKERIFNDYLSGEVDFYLGESIYKATNVTDCKNAFDYPTYLKKVNKGLENGQREQLQGYGDITSAQDLFVANCLISFSPDMVMDMKYKVMRKLNCATEESPEFLEEWPKWEKSMFFDKIDQHKRVFKIKVEPFTKEEQQKIYDRVKYGRDFLWEFDEKYQKMNL